MTHLFCFVFKKKKTHTLRFGSYNPNKVSSFFFPLSSLCCWSYKKGKPAKKIKQKHPPPTHKKKKKNCTVQSKIIFVTPNCSGADNLNKNERLFTQLKKKKNYKNNLQASVCYLNMKLQCDK